MNNILRTRFSVPDGVKRYKSLFGVSMVRMPAETFETIRRRLDAANKIQAVSDLHRNFLRKMTELDSFKAIEKAAAETAAAKKETENVRLEYAAFIKQTNKTYSVFNRFLETNPALKKEFLRQRGELARAQENRSKDYGGMR